MNLSLLAQAGAELLPPRDEFGLPAAIGLFHLLIPLTFALHAVFMNFAVGAALVLPPLCVAGRRRDDLRDLARAIIRAWPVAISLTITSGVAILLFVQVLYGHVFYTANILLGWRWLAVLGYLLVGFYFVYLLDGLVARGRLGATLGVLLLVALAFLMIAHEFNNNSVLMLLPEKWRAIRDGDAGKHAHHPMWLPRMLHTLVGSIAVTGLWVAGIGRLAPSFAPLLRRLAVVIGLRIALVATVVQILTGLWFVVALEAPTQKALLDVTSPRTWLWALAVVGGLLLVVWLWKAAERPDDPLSVWGPAALVAFILVGMASGRESIRLEMLSRLAGALYEADDVRPQSGALLLFLLTLLAGLIVLGVLARWVWIARPRPVDR